MLKSLASRLRFGVGAIILAFTASGLISVAGLLASARDLSRVIDSSGPVIVAIDRMETSILSQSLLCLRYSNAREPSVLAAMEEEKRGFAEAKGKLAALWGGESPVGEEIYGEYDSFLATESALVEAVDQLARLENEGAPTARLAAAEMRIPGLKEGVSKAQADLLDHFERVAREPTQAALARARGEAAASAWRSLAIFGILTLVAVAFGLGAGRLIMKGLRGPIDELTEAMERIASGDRSARLEDVGVAEFEALESSFNDMAERLDEAEQGLMRSYEGQRKILDEIPVGFLTLDGKFKVAPEYSSATERIFNRRELAGLDFAELVYPGGEAARVDELSRYLRQLFSNTTADKDFLDDINPVSNIVIAGPAGERDIAIGFDRIYEGNSVADLLVTIEDRTEVILAGKALEAERLARKRDSDSIQAILSIGPGPLRDFFTETREMIARIRGDLGKLGDISCVHSTFRLLHSIKGMAGSFGIEAVATTAHEAEDIFAALRESGAAPTTQELVRINVLLGVMGDELDAFEDLVQRLKATLLKLEEKDARGEAEDEVGDFVASLSAMVGQLEKSLAKPMDFSAEVKAAGLPHFREMKAVIIHLIRNSADHGIEDEFERLFQGKPKRGSIKLLIGKREGPSPAFVVEVEDDGQGLNFERIADKAVAKGMLSAASAKEASKAQLLSCIFKPGFSTKDMADEISGRGVGLDLVRDTVKSLGGSIAVSSSRGRGTRFTVTLPA